MVLMVPLVLMGLIGLMVLICLKFGYNLPDTSDENSIQPLPFVLNRRVAGSHLHVWRHYV